jgi:Heparinase II/III-like protein
VIEGASLREGLELFAYPQFGVWIYRSTRLFLAIRCGKLGQNGRGGHDHNDQLAFELAIDGEDWVSDPGTYLYTPSRKGRNAYRSVNAHAAPRFRGQEPASLTLGDFWLGDQAKAQCDVFGPDGFEGHHMGFGHLVRRTIKIHPNRIRIVDQGLDHQTQISASTPQQLRQAVDQNVPFSPGYGLPGSPTRR